MYNASPPQTGPLHLAFHYSGALRIVLFSYPHKDSIHLQRIPTPHSFFLSNFLGSPGEPFFKIVGHFANLATDSRLFLPFFSSNVCISKVLCVFVFNLCLFFGVLCFSLQCRADYCKNSARHCGRKLIGPMPFARFLSCFSRWLRSPQAAPQA